MSGIKTYVQTNMMVPPTEPKHLVRLSDLEDHTSSFNEMTFDIIGDDTTTTYSFTHNLDTLNVTHEVFDDAGDTVFVSFSRVSADAVSVSFGVPLGVGTDFTLLIRAV